MHNHIIYSWNVSLANSAALSLLWPAVISFKTVTGGAATQ